MENIINIRLTGAGQAAQAMNMILDTQRRGVSLTGEQIKGMRTVISEANLMRRAQTNLVQSWRLSHPELSILTRGLSNVATVGHVLTNAFQTLNIMQLRQRQGVRDVTDAQQDYNDKQIIAQKMLQKYGELHPKYLDALGEEREALNTLNKLKDALKSDEWVDLGTKISIALSLTAVPANILNAITAFGFLGKALVDLQILSSQQSLLMIGSKTGKLSGFLGIAGAALVAVAAIELLAAMGKQTADAPKMTQAQIDELIKSGKYPPIPPYPPRTKEEIEAGNKRSNDPWGALEAIWKWLFPPSQEAFGETGGGIPQHEPSQLPFGKGGAIGEFPARPPLTFGEKATQLATEATNTEARLNSELATIQAEADRVEQQINTEVRSLVPHTGVPSDRLQNLVAEQSKLELAREELNNIIQRREQARRFKDLTGIDLDTYNRVAKIAYDEGVSIADISPNIGVRLGLTPSSGGGGLVGNRVTSVGGIADYEKLFGKDIALLGSVPIIERVVNDDGSITLLNRQVSAEEYRIQRDIANGGQIYPIYKGLDYYGNAKYDPSTLNINPDRTIGRSDRENFIAGLYGFAGGGVINEPIIGMGMHSGKGYSFGESGPETITPGRGGMVVNVYVSGSLVAEADLIRKVSEGVARGIQRQVR